MIRLTEMTRHSRTSAILIIALIGQLMSAGFAVAQRASEADASQEAGLNLPERTVVDAKKLKDGESAVDLLNAPGLSRGVDAIIAEIRKREVDLALREQRVAERERAVVALESMIEKRAMDLDRIREEVEGRIAGWSAQGRDRVSQLADVYSAMPPQRAGQLLNKLELDLAVAVVRSMKKKSSAGVLGAMRPDRALLVSRRMLKPLDPTTDSPAKRAR